MKKLAILFLLTTVLVAFTFAQVSEKVTFEIDNVSEENGTTATPAKKTIKLLFLTEASASQEIGPGSLGIYSAFTLGQKWQDKLNGDGLVADDIELKLSYSLAAGPGTLTPYLDWNWGDGKGAKIIPGVGYSGFAAGPATLGFDVQLQYGYATGNSSSGTYTDQGLDKLELAISAAFDFGLSVTYKFDYDLDEKKGRDKGDFIGENVARIAYLDINYKLLDEKLVVGLELDDTNSNFSGFTLKPYASYTLNDNLSAGLYVKVKNINADDSVESGIKSTLSGNADNSQFGKPDIFFSPGLWVKYSI
jgi:hypothetical protein